MAVTFVGGDTTGGNVADTSTLAGDARLIWPTVAADDVALVFWTFSNARTPTTPSGFTLVTNNDGGAGSMRTYIYRKVCAGTEDGVVLATINDAANRQSACLVVYRGVDTTTPVDGNAVDTSHTTGTTHNNPALAPTVNNCVVLTSIHERATSIDAAWTPPSGYTERADTLTLATGSGGTITAVADDGLAAGRDTSSVTPGVWTGDHATGTGNIVTYTLALRAAASASEVFGTAVAALSSTRTASGTRTVNGTAARSTTFTATAIGVPTVNGQAAAALTPTATASGTRTVNGAAPAAPSFVATAAGTRTVQGSTSTAPTFTAVVGGTRTVNGQLAASLAFTGSASGVTSSVTGTAAAVLTFAASAAGVRSARPMANRDGAHRGVRPRDSVRGTPGNRRRRR